MLKPYEKSHFKSNCVLNNNDNFNNAYAILMAATIKGDKMTLCSTERETYVSS